MWYRHLLSSAADKVRGRNSPDVRVYQFAMGIIAGGIILAYEPTLVKEKVAPYSLTETDMPVLKSCLNSRKRHGFKLQSSDMMAISGLGGTPTENLCACMTKYATSHYTKAELESYKIVLGKVVEADATGTLKGVFVGNMPKTLVKAQNLRINVEQTYRRCRLFRTHKPENIPRIAELKAQQ